MKDLGISLIAGACILLVIVAEVMIACKFGIETAFTLLAIVLIIAGAVLYKLGKDKQGH